MFARKENAPKVESLCVVTMEKHLTVCASSKPSPALNKSQFASNTKESVVCINHTFLRIKINPLSLMKLIILSHLMLLKRFLDENIKSVFSQ